MAKTWRLDGPSWRLGPKPRPVRGVPPGHPESYSAWNAARLRSLVRRLPAGSVYRQALERQLALEESQLLSRGVPGRRSRL